MELTSEVKAALTHIFERAAPHGSMDVRELGSFFDKCSGQTSKYTNLQLRSIILRYNPTMDDKLGLEGFLAYYAETAFLNPKEVWQHLHAQGYGNELRQDGEGGADAALPKDALDLPALSMECLLMPTFYSSSTLDASEGSVIAIASRVSYKRQDVSKQVTIHRAMVCVFSFSTNT